MLLAVAVAVTVLAGALWSLLILVAVVALIKYQYYLLYPVILYQYTPPLFLKGPQWK